MKGKVEFYRSKNGWRWRARAANGRIIANCGQGYSRRTDCVKGFEIVAGDSLLAWPRTGL